MDMFYDDINRKVNGVIKVDQDETSVISQEVREYVITKELKKHFISFFNYYGDSFTTPTSDMGVWISGFFGSGKSHFLKMLSYLLENKEIDGVKTVERFREKFADDPATFMLIDNATRYETETILFNIDIEGSINKDKTAVLRVFAKMFYNHLGFYGENLKVAMLEKYIDQSGKTEEFRRVFEEKKGKPWVEQRKAYSLQTFVDKLNDKPGIISVEELERAYHNEGVVVSEMFFPDKDNIIPICDDDYFDDDITDRFIKWVEMVYGADTLEENLKFIANALGGKGSAREVIRNYFISDFYADHLKTYQKRPIYWLFDSGKKGGFKALIYMHRYQPDTIARIRTDYVHEQQSRYRTAIADLQQRMGGASTGDRVKLTKQLTKLEAQAEEIRTYEEKTWMPKR